VLLAVIVLVALLTIALAIALRRLQQLQRDREQEPWSAASNISAPSECTTRNSAAIAQHRCAGQAHQQHPLPAQEVCGPNHRQGGLEAGSPRPEQGAHGDGLLRTAARRDRRLRAESARRKVLRQPLTASSFGGTASTSSFGATAGNSSSNTSNCGATG